MFAFLTSFIRSVRLDIWPRTEISESVACRTVPHCPKLFRPAVKTCKENKASSTWTTCWLEVGVYLYPLLSRRPHAIVHMLLFLWVHRPLEVGGGARLQAHQTGLTSSQMDAPTQMNSCLVHTQRQTPLQERDAMSPAFSRINKRSKEIKLIVTFSSSLARVLAVERRMCNALPSLWHAWAIRPPRHILVLSWHFFMRRSRNLF